MTFQATGTTWNISSTKNLEPKTENLIRKFIDQFEDVYSRFRSNSLVSQVANTPGTYHFPINSKRLFETYHKLHALTQGKFTPLIGKLEVQAGYDPTLSFKASDLETLPAWDKVIDFNNGILTTYAPIQLDFGAAGKGYLVDLVGELLEQNGIDNYVIDAGGDIKHKSKTSNDKCQIGLENPSDPKQAIGVAEISNQSICGSSGNRRTWANFHHIFDPDKLESAKNVLATWVIAKETIVADGLATALFFTHPEIFIQDFEFDYLILYPDFTISKSVTWPGEIFT